jgi:hypothetical protein
MASMMIMVRRRSGSSYLRTKEPLVCGGPAGQRTQGMATWGQWRLASLLKSFVRNKNNAQGSVHVCRWWKSVTRPPFDQLCDPRNFPSIGFVFRH